MEIECDECGKTFSRKPSEIGKNTYCSKRCFYSAISKDKTLNGNYKGGKVVSCDVCGKKHYRNPHKLKTITGKFFCSYKCHSIWVSINLIGEKAYNYKDALHKKICKVCNEPFTTYSLNQAHCSKSCGNKTQRNRISLTCSYCSTIYERTASSVYWAKKRGSKNSFCSIKCKRLHNVGEKAPIYKKDRTKIKDQNKSERWSKRMKEWRLCVYERDKYSCQMCGCKSSSGNAVVLNSHHIVKFSVSNKKKFDIRNGITLCESCHKKTYGKEESFEHSFNTIINSVCREKT